MTTTLINVAVSKVLSHVSFVHLGSSGRVTEACPLNPSFFPQIEKPHPPSSYLCSLQFLLPKSWVGKEVDCAGNRVKENNMRKSFCCSFKSKEQEVKLSIQYGRAIFTTSMCLGEKKDSEEIPIELAAVLWGWQDYGWYIYLTFWMFFHDLRS